MVNREIKIKQTPTKAENNNVRRQYDPGLLNTNEPCLTPAV
jgi:hypothetical protein